MANVIGDEVARLQPWYDLSVRKRGRTTVGASGLDMPAIIEMIAGLAEGASAGEDPQPSANKLKLITEDFKAFYFEAALAQPAGANSLDVQNWFWGSTAAASTLFMLHKTLSVSSDADIRRFAGWLLVPQSQVHRLSDT